MNLRYEILKACAANPGAPIDEIADTIKYDRKKTAWAVRDCAKEGLLSKRLDDVTGQLGYTLTAEGKQRLAEGPGSKQGSNMKKACGDSEGGEADEVAFMAPTDPAERPAAADEKYGLLGILADVRAAVGDREGRLMQDELVEHIRAIYDLGEAHKRACLAWESAMMGAVGEDGVNDVVGKIADLQHRISMQDAELFKQAGTIVDLRGQIEALQREAMRGATLLSGDDRYTAAGYLVRAPKRPLRTFSNAESAQAAAMAAARNGSGRGEVFALVPVGRAVRGAEWRPS